MRGKLAGKGQMQAVRQSRESKMWLPSAWREKKITPDLQSMHVCCNESNVAAKWRRLINLLGERRKQTSTHNYDQTPQRASAFLWMNAINTRGKKKKQKTSEPFSICAHRGRTAPGCDAAEC